MLRWISDLLGTKLSVFWVGQAKFDSSALSANRILTVPNKSGTVAMIDDIATAINPISGFQAHKNATNQDFATSNATKLSWSTEVFDVNSEFAFDRFTVISSGKYWIAAAGHITSFGVGTTSVKLMLYKNGSLFKVLTTTAVLTDMTMQGGLIVDVADGDYFEIFIQFVGLVSGTATLAGASTETWFNAMRQASSPGNETTTSLGAITNLATAKTAPVDADMIPLMDSAVSNIWKKLSWADLKATLKTYFDTLYVANASGNVPNVIASNLTLPADTSVVVGRKITVNAGVTLTIPVKSSITIV